MLASVGCMCVWGVCVGRFSIIIGTWLGVKIFLLSILLSHSCMLFVLNFLERFVDEGGGGGGGNAILGCEDVGSPRPGRSDSQATVV